MTGDEHKAQAAFQETIRAAASHSAEGEPPNDRMWFYREARWRCLAAGAHGVQPEDMEIDETRGQRPKLPSNYASLSRNSSPSGSQARPIRSEARSRFFISTSSTIAKCVRCSS